MSIEEIKRKHAQSIKDGEFRIFAADIEFLLEQIQQLREERDSFQRVGIKVQEQNQRLVEALEKCVELGECQLDYGGSIDALEQVAEVASKALQANKDK